VDTRLWNALRAVSAAATAFLESKGDRQLLLQTVVRTVAEAVPDLAVISLVQANEMMVVAVHDESAAIRAVYTPLLHRRRPISVVAAAAIDKPVFQPRVDVDALASQLPPDSGDILRNIRVRGMIVVPMRSRGRLLGLLSVLRHREDRPELDETDRETVELLAAQAALALGTEILAAEHDALIKDLEQSKFLDALIENIPDMVFVKEAGDLTFVRFNRAGEELLGIPRAQLMGKGDRDFFPADEAEFFIAKDRETLASGKLVDIPEEPIKTAHGERWLHTKKVPIVDDKGTPRFLLGISEDITERKQAIAELAAARDKAEAANRELESFSYSVAHDLRAPLRAIDGFAQALLEDYGAKLDIVGKRHLERIRAAAQRMATLIDDLLRLSRVTRHEQKREVVNLSAVARIAVAQIERADPSRNVEIVIEDNLHALADHKLIAIVFDNLFGNAWKFTSKTPHPRIELGSKQGGDGTIYFVRDNGAGFDMTYQNKLFGTFARLHAAHEFPGTGIGLATVKRIIDRHGGRVWAEGAVGKGATFFFTLGDVS
jgi:PAS domain S-box-containing protein